VGGVQTKEFYFGVTIGVFDVGQIAVIVKFGGAHKGQGVKIQFQQLFVGFVALIFYQPRFGQINKLQQQRQEILGRFWLAIMLVGLSQFPQPDHVAVDFSQGFSDTGIGILKQAFQFQKRFFIKFCRKHRPGPIHQIMSLVNQKGVVAAIIGKKALEINPGIKNIVVITDHAITPEG
jgi:hypothetical protein